MKLVVVKCVVKHAEKVPTGGQSIILHEYIKKKI